MRRICRRCSESPRRLCTVTFSLLYLTDMTTVKKTTVKKSATKSAPAAAVKYSGKGTTISSKTVFTSRTFWVTSDEVTEPGGVRAHRDVIRHGGSVVILAVDEKTNPKDPGILLIRQYRYAAGKFLLELPAGRIEPGEKLIPSGKRELIEETGYRAKKWSRHANYYASPGFLTETMTILLAEDLTLGEATPEEDEKIEVHMTPLSEVLCLIHAGKIEDGKTLIGVLLYASLWEKKASTKRS
jgi:ADP-ribose pyrophosphatase